MSRKGSTNRVFVIAEAGSNWIIDEQKKNLVTAKKLINTAAQCGADAIKFQVFRPNLIYVSNAGKSNYLKKSGIHEDINSMFTNLAIPYDVLGEINDYCKREQIEFMASAFSVQDAREINKFVQRHKIASYEINHVRLLEYLSTTKKPIIVSTGASNYSEIDFAINFLKDRNVKKISLLQCTAKYPTDFNDLNLNVISQFKSKYRLPVGLSDHSLDPVIGPLIAVGLGARIIEKHFTLDKNSFGPDHKFSLNPKELRIMINNIRNAEKTFGDENKHVLDIEKELRKFATRKIQAIQDIKKGDVLVEGKNFDILRPGERSDGADARFLFDIIGKKVNKNIKKGDGIKLKNCF